MQYIRCLRLCLALALALLPGFQAHALPDNATASLDGLAERYVRLVLAIGEHDANMVDAYYGPPQWREDARAQKRSLDVLASDAGMLADELAKVAATDELSVLRRRALSELLASIRARVEILRGKNMSFDEEARLVYGVAPPRHDDDFYRAIHRQLDTVVPGTGPLRERMDAFKENFVVPPDRIRSVLVPALEACRSTTLRRITMPDGEDFHLELVTDKPWSAYNWFQGDYQSLIEVNVSLPFYAGSAARLMCHEGYPGHHVLNSLLEQTIAWLQEFTFATRGQAEQQLRFYETYRSYVVNYRLGEDLVGQYIDRVAGKDADARWKALSALLSSPPVVSDLARGTTLDPSS